MRKLTLIIFNIILILNLLYRSLFKKNISKSIIKISFILLFLMFLINISKGIDYLVYLEYFNYYGVNLITKSNYYGVELIFGLLCYLFNHIGLSGNHLLILYYALSIYFIYKSVSLLDDFKNNYLLFVISLVLFCFSPFLTITRQFLSVSLFFYSVVLNYKGFRKKSIICFILSIAFHTSAIFCLPFYLLLSYKGDINKLLKILIPIICFILGKTDIIKRIMLNIIQIFGETYASYVVNTSSNVFEKTGLLLLFMFVLYSFQFIVSKKKNNDTHYILLEKGEMIFFSLMFLTNGLGYLRRLAYFFIIFESFIFITFFKKFNYSENKKIIYPLLLAIIYGFTMYVLIISNLN